MNKWIGVILISFVFIHFDCKSKEVQKFYFGASIVIVGYADADITPYKVGVGYNFDKNFSIEVNSFKFGEKDLFFASDEFTAEGYSIEMLAKYPFGDFSLYGKLGALRWSEEGMKNDSPMEENNLIHIKDTGTDLIYGLGFSYSITENFSLKIEYLKSNINKHAVNPFSIGFDIIF
jgi:opacity protein-like surface antigen